MHVPSAPSAPDHSETVVVNEAPTVNVVSAQTSASEAALDEAEKERIQAEVKHQVDKVMTETPPPVADHPKPAETHVAPAAAPHPAPEAASHAAPHAESHSHAKESPKKTGKLGKVWRGVKSLVGNRVEKVKSIFSKDKNKEEVATLINVVTYLPRTAFWGVRKVASGAMNLVTLGLATKLYEKRAEFRKWLKGGQETADAKGVWGKAKAFLLEPKRAATTAVIALAPWATVPAAAILSLALIVGAGRDMVRPGGFPDLSPSKTAAKVENKAKAKEG